MMKYTLISLKTSLMIDLKKNNYLKSAFRLESLVKNRKSNKSKMHMRYLENQMKERL